MKKITAILLSLCMILSLASCSGDANEEGEIVLIDEFMTELDNVAKSKQHVGEEATVFGRVKEILANYCIVESLKTNIPDIYVRMPSKTLAEMSADDFICVTGKIKSFSALRHSYTLKAKTIEDKTVSDEILRGYIAELESRTYWSGYTFTDEFRSDVIYDYLSSRGNVFQIMDDNNLRSYLIGNWNHKSVYVGESHYIAILEFRADGTYYWDKPHSPDQDGDWSVANGKLDSFIGTYPQSVFILSDNIFYCMGTLNIRITEKN